ncbi:KICSTOR complex protein kaptin-like isoform X2 [Venturia canescens]|uniref:KICSTOR complex protein kaptin-like isoform X2 n=1 Tax=Venturia canescens TaxID=32260 RepID=UPI001C9C7BD2|nr:KICSTOR complex protein kaptin-like isoform X2 [Venturia canescens]
MKLLQAMSLQQNDLADLIEAHWLSLPSQGNIYSMTKLKSSNNSHKVLVASLKRKIYSCEYHPCPTWYLRPLVKEQLFTYIPSGAEIISIDAYNKQDSGNELVIGVTLIKQNNESSVERYLNIYTEGVGDGDSEESSSIESIAQNCLMVELNYTPYHLYHTFLPPTDAGSEIVWLISGDDQNIHMIREDKLSHGYAEIAIEKYFPELADLRAVALKIDIYYYANSKKRLTVVGCKCGLVKVSLIDVEKFVIIKCWTLRYDSPVCSVNIFPDRMKIHTPEFIKHLDSTKNEKSDENPFLNILIVNALNGTVVFTDVLNLGMTSDVTLIKIESTDCVLCSCIADINMDGKNEILLGTYDQELIIFTLRGNIWELTNRKQFDAPIYSIAYVDLTGDGVKELIVMTQQGVHIMQHDPKEVNRKWKKRLNDLLSRNLLSTPGT